jgi:hypothetical protein
VSDGLRRLEGASARAAAVAARLLEPVTAADVQALRATAQVEERREGERVEVRFGPRPGAPD